MLADVYHIVVFFVVPGIILAVLVGAVYLSQRVPYRTSARAGLLAGLVAFAIYVAGSFPSFNIPPQSAKTLPAFHWIPAIAGLVIGFSLPVLLQYLKQTHALVGLFILFLVGSSSSAAFSYYFTSPRRSPTFYFVLSALLGVLLYVISFSENNVVRQMFGGNRDNWE
jgi:hypothetical protein